MSLVILLLAVIAGTAVAAKKITNKTNGSGLIEGASFEISAKDSAKGVSGFAQVDATPFFTAQGSVVCYTVRGANSAIIVVELEQATGDVDAALLNMVLRPIDNKDVIEKASDELAISFISKEVDPCAEHLLTAPADVASGNISVKNFGK